MCVNKMPSRKDISNQNEHLINYQVWRWRGDHLGLFSYTGPGHLAVIESTMNSSAVLF